ncbi:hypothetical protein 2 [Hubei sobemo-like virus 12]|uniref:hypothetical protein 2 n=1 Tax=Hubei sobemo-like virus 12 TaxID=1923197 RepID=UPI00090A2F37|nr:hypothetical protein 2 [Hubei sobemo-like virus 12]APG75824.1 hypothetical protein 2 [Hubei sobemo-like virus 12]
MDFDQARVQDLHAVVFERIRQLEAGEYVCDPIKVFVKQEPHKAKKLTNEKYRLISAVSLVDTMIDRILGRSFFESVLENNLEVPSAIGWSPNKGGYRALRAIFPKGEKVFTSDKSNWDWTVQKWLICAFFEVVNELCYTEDKELYQRWYALLWKRCELLFNRAFFKFQDGTIVQQKLPGLQKSGCYWTIVLNTVGQDILHVAAGGVGRILGLGDDIAQEVEVDPEKYLERVQRYGCEVKEFSIDKVFDFGGYHYEGEIPTPVYHGKHVYQMVHAEVGDVALWDSYLGNYAGDEEWFEAIRKVARRVTGRIPKSRNYYLSLWKDE